MMNRQANYDDSYPELSPEMQALMEVALDPMLTEDTDERPALIEPDLHGFMAQHFIAELQSSLDEAWFHQFATPEEALLTLRDDVLEAVTRVVMWLFAMYKAANAAEK